MTWNLRFQDRTRVKGGRRIYNPPQVNNLPHRAATRKAGGSLRGCATVRGGRMKIVAARRFRKTSVRSHEHQINPRGPKAVERNQLRARTRGMIESLRAVTMKQRDRMELGCGI